jgi:hypothetical protein
MDRKQGNKLIWRHTHRDYKGKIGQVRHVLVFRAGTCSVPLDSLTEAEYAERLEWAQRAEARRPAK